MATDDAIDLNRDLPTSFRLEIGNLMLAWGAYDSAVTYWLAKSLGISLEVASIMFGKMDIDTKLLRLKDVHEHFGHTEAAEGLKNLRKMHEQRKEARNIIAHSRCVGRSRSQPNDVAFSALWHVKREPGVMALKLLPLSEIQLATSFANEAYHSIMRLAAEMVPVVPSTNIQE